MVSLDLAGLFLLVHIHYFKSFGQKAGSFSCRAHKPRADDKDSSRTFMFKSFDGHLWAAGLQHNNITGFDHWFAPTQIERRWDCTTAQ